jgi:hypothetical protein
MRSACHIECDTRDVSVVRVGQKEDGAGDFIGLGEPAHRQLRGPLRSVGGCVRAGVLSELCAHMAVLTGPGATALTEMPLGPSIWANDHT